MSKKIDKDSLRIIADNINKCADDLIQVYPYVFISDDGLKYGNKQTNIKDPIVMLKYCSYQLKGVLMEVSDD